MVWSVADLTFAENLSAARAAFGEWGTLCLPRPVTALGRPVGQWLTNCRCPGGLGADPDRADKRGRELAAVGVDWNPVWAADLFGLCPGTALRWANHASGNWSDYLATRPFGFTSES
jgi:hypothetical protein